jgi:antitoxin ParD1/3/4
MSIILKPEQEYLVQQQLALGRFHSVDEVLERALRLLDEQYQEDEMWIEDMRVKVDEAKVEFDRGEVLPLETVITNLQEKFRQARNNKA